MTRKKSSADAEFWSTRARKFQNPWYFGRYSSDFGSPKINLTSPNKKEKNNNIENQISLNINKKNIFNTQISTNIN